MATFTDIKIFKAGQNAPKGILANGSCLVAGVVEIKFALREGPRGVFASLPSVKSNKKNPETGKDIYYPQVRFPDEETYSQFQKVVKDAFEASKSGQSSQPTDSADDSLPF